ncbi:RHS repeat-associated core domain-containing protein, partial [Flavobacterium psychrophilum]
SSFKSPYLFNGKELDRETNLTNFGARYLDMKTSLWLTIDPLAEQGPEYSPYCFTMNNPINMVDPDGRWPYPIGPISLIGIINSVKNYFTGDSNKTVSTIRSVSAEGAYTGIKSSAVRETYKSTVSKLDISDSAGRTSAKLAAREQTPAVVKSIIESQRPTSVEIAKVSGSANKTNAVANGTADAFGKAGKGLLVVGLAASAYNISTAENKVQATAVEGGSWAGAIAGGELLGSVGATGGPYGAVAGAVVGSIVGGVAGEKTVQGVVNKLNSPHPNKVDETKLICFVVGTKITMSDFSTKNIEDVKTGDLIQTYNTETNTAEIKEVLLPEISNSDSFVEIKFEDGTLNTNTLTHPYYVVKKGWCSYDSKEAIKKYNVKVDTLKKGDYVYKLNNNGTVQNLKIISIKMIKMKQKTYNLSNIKDNHNFFANGILVHNRS